jgi:ABC-type transport system involved in multi-copper enzyme maturation permease subunit
VSGGEPATPVDAQVPAAAVHDLGYKRYLGTRRPQNTRYRVIVGNVLSMAWRGWWRAKIWIVGSAAGVFVLGLLMLTFREKLGASASGPAGELILSFPDTILAISFRLAGIAAFLFGLIAVAGTVTRDLGAGAFEFYFSRPVRSLDYVLGKLVGSCLLLGAPLLAGPTLLALFRVGLETDNLGKVWLVIPQTMLTGAISTVVYAAVPLAFSALARRPRDAMILYAAFYVVIGGVLRVAAEITGTRAIAAFDIYDALLGITYGFYGWDVFAGRALPPQGASLAVMALYAAAAVALLFWRVRAIERAGIGGGS